MGSRYRAGLPVITHNAPASVSSMLRSAAAAAVVGGDDVLVSGLVAVKMVGTKSISKKETTLKVPRLLDSRRINFLS